MTYYQQCWTLVIAILAIAVHIDPVTEYIVCNPIQIATRFFFALYYMAMTSPEVVIQFTRAYPMTAIEFYFKLMKQYKAVYPEMFDEDGKLRKEYDQ